MKILFALSVLTTIVLSTALIPSFKCSEQFPGEITFAGDDHAELFMCGKSVYRSNRDVQTFRPAESCREIFLKVENTGLSSGFAMSILSHETGQYFVTTTERVSNSLKVAVTADNIDDCIVSPWVCQRHYWKYPVYVSSLSNVWPFTHKDLRSHGAYPLGIQDGDMSSTTYSVFIKNPFCAE